MMQHPFKSLDPEKCGPHCLAKDTGFGKHTNINHCPKCHDEAELPIEERPQH